MLDCAGVDTLRLRFPSSGRDDLVLSQGVHAIGHGPAGKPEPVDDPASAHLQLCVDRRGVWLQLREGVRGLYVNGRPVRRMAMLRAGDAIHVDGVELALIGAHPLPAPDQVRAPEVNRRLVLRGVGGIHHGRCFALDRPHLVGRSAEAEVRSDEPGIAERHARLEPHCDGLALRSLDADALTLVDGHPVRDAWLAPGSQVVFGAGQRFVLEAPMSMANGGVGEAVLLGPDASTDPGPVRPPAGTSMRRLPWLLLAAAMLAGALTLLLLYGAR